MGLQNHQTMKIELINTSLAKRIFFSLILSFVGCITVQAQDQLLARVEYEKAETAFNNENFNAALTSI
ncbi:hypothetical protein C5745_03645 [Sphingobacterium haloxyli]|uniref:Uncharacterized protein n=1 Tax=Sphingobacterium haloxyli TaxID=2100533 RepID=A0A2S9J8C9_9SPHI|nr:hypothetical protein C5745_03645 [Sphingobacterium haloxyli]